VSPQRNRFQGYAAPGREPGAQISERQSFNVQGFDSIDDALAAGYPDDVGTSLFPAVWPEEPAEFRDVWRSYFRAMEGFAHRLLAIFEHALGLPDGWFGSQIEHHHSSLVANYYSFDVDSGRDPSPFRFKAHVDGSILTILYQDDGPGSLQLHQRGKGWRDVRAVEGAYVVNLGELMARWTNDRFVATPHRVLRPPETEREPRLSVPFFLKPSHDTVIAPIPELLGAGEAPAYAPVTGRTWLNGRQRNEYDSSAAFAQIAERDPILR
jgi:isopenicillin N synthase-like dioxygenase